MKAVAIHCYLCGKNLAKNEVTRDHVPPLGLFPRPRPSNLITVPCCAPCNNGKSKEEELFRLIATLGVNQTPEAAAVYASSTLPKTIQKKRLKNEVKMLLESTTYVWSEVSGVIRPLLTLRLPVQRLCPVIERIARGLTAHFYPTLSVHQLSFEASIPTRNAFFEVFDLVAGDLAELSVGGRTFHSYHGNALESEKVGIWIMTFHEVIPAIVLYFDSDHSELSSNRGKLFIP